MQSLTLSASVTDYQFAGPQATVVTTGIQRLTGAAEAPIALSSGGPSNFRYGLCYQSAAGGPIQNFVGGLYSIGEIDTTRSSWAASATVVLGAGTWRVGFCVAPQGVNLTINDNDFVNGWVMVTNQ